MKVSPPPDSADYRLLRAVAVIAPMVKVLTRQPVARQIAVGLGACLGRPDSV